MEPERESETMFVQNGEWEGSPYTVSFHLTLNYCFLLVLSVNFVIMFKIWFIFFRLITGLSLSIACICFETFVFLFGLTMFNANSSLLCILFLISIVNNKFYKEYLSMLVPELTFQMIYR